MSDPYICVEHGQTSGVRGCPDCGHLVEVSAPVPGEPKTTRIRRGRVVVIPEEWRGKITDRQTIRKRQSKLTRKMRNATKAKWRPGGFYSPRDRDEARAPSIDEWSET